MAYRVWLSTYLYWTKWEKTPEPGIPKPTPTCFPVFGVAGHRPRVDMAARMPNWLYGADATGFNWKWKCRPSLISEQIEQILPFWSQCEHFVLQLRMWGISLEVLNFRANGANSSEDRHFDEHQRETGFFLRFVWARRRTGVQCSPHSGSFGSHAKHSSISNGSVGKRTTSQRRCHISQPSSRYFRDLVQQKWIKEFTHHFSFDLNFRFHF